MVAVVLLLAQVCASPNVIQADVTEEDPGRLQSQKSDLGLDLRGGSYLLVEVDIQKALAERLHIISAGITAPLRQTRIKHSSGIQDSKIFIELHDPGEMERARELIHNDAQNYAVSENGRRIEIDVPEERMREIRTSIMNEIQTSIMNEFFWNEGARTPPEAKP